MNLDASVASRMANIALGHVAREYPNKLDHVLLGDEDALPPRVLHPIFFGSFDWHSCVHGWWTLLTLRRSFPQITEVVAITALANETFTQDKVAAELAYLDRPLSRGFERPYGWAWLLYLHLEAVRHADSWGTELEPLARAFAGRLGDYLGILTYPIRVGTHFNTAFALILSLEWADAFDPELAALIRDRTRHWYGTDRDCQAWEPGGDEFLSPALIEALCMARAHKALFPIWFEQFLPRIAAREPATLPSGSCNPCSRTPVDTAQPASGSRSGARPRVSSMPSRTTGRVSRSTSPIASSSPVSAGVHRGPETGRGPGSGSRWRDGSRAASMETSSPMRRRGADASSSACRAADRAGRRSGAVQVAAVIVAT